MTLTVIILAYNSKAFVRESVDSALTNVVDGVDVNLLVVDNGSSDGCAQLLETVYANVQAVSVTTLNPGRSFAAANDWAVRQSTSDIVLFLNDDCVLEPGALGHVIEEFARDRTLGALQLATKTADGRYWDSLGHFMDTFGLLADVGAGAEAHALEGSPVRVFGGYGAALAVRRSAYDAAGGFDTVMDFLGEETDLCWRLWLVGFEVASSRAAFARHRHLSRYEGDARAARPRSNQLEFQHRFRSMAKNCGLRWAVWALPLHTMLRVGSAVVGLGGHPVPALRDVWAGLVWNWRNRRSLLGARSRIQSQRRVRDGELIGCGVVASRGLCPTLVRFARRVRGGSKVARLGRGALPVDFRVWW